MTLSTEHQLRSGSPYDGTTKTRSIQASGLSRPTPSQGFVSDRCRTVGLGAGFGGTGLSGAGANGEAGGFGSTFFSGVGAGCWDDAGGAGLADGAGGFAAASAFASDGGAGAGEAGLALCTALLPTKTAPSWISKRRVINSPLNRPVLEISTFSVALSLPSTWPRIKTELASIVACTLLSEPITRVCFGMEMEPSTEPSTNKFSLLWISPLKLIDCPMREVPSLGVAAGGAVGLGGASWGRGGASLGFELAWLAEASVCAPLDWSSLRPHMVSLEIV